MDALSVFSIVSAFGGSDYPKKSPIFTPTFKSSETHSTLRGRDSPSPCLRRTSILTVQAGRLKIAKTSPVLSYPRNPSCPRISRSPFTYACTAVDSSIISPRNHKAFSLYFGPHGPRRSATTKQCIQRRH